jgi:hypothetical protein
VPQHGANDQGALKAFIQHELIKTSSKPTMMMKMMMTVMMAIMMMC